MFCGTNNIPGYSKHAERMWEYLRILHGQLSVSQNIVMDLNDVLCDHKKHNIYLFTYGLILIYTTKNNKYN